MDRFDAISFYPSHRSNGLISYLPFVSSLFAWCVIKTMLVERICRDTYLLWYISSCSPSFNMFCVVSVISYASLSKIRYSSLFLCVEILIDFNKRRIFVVVVVVFSSLLPTKHTHVVANNATTCTQSGTNKQKRNEEREKERERERKSIRWQRLCLVYFLLVLFVW